MSALRIGLIGLGQMGQAHLRILSMLKSADVAFVYDTDEEKTRRAASDHGIAVADDLFSALDDVDAVVICAPTSHHAQYVQDAALRVRNIFVEKPLAATLDDAAKLHELSVREDLFVQVGFIERFNPAVQQLRRILTNSQRVVNVDFTRTNKLSARIADVDVVTDLMIHDIDLALHLNGPVAAVTAHGAADGPMVNFASAMLTHTNGRLSRILASRITEKKVRSVQATCTDAYVSCDLLRKEIIINRQSELTETEGEPYVISATEETVEVRPQEALLGELQAFIAACSSSEVPDVPTAEDGFRAQVVCEQIREEILR